MGSEAPTNTRIFFKDKNNELKGPFTERQVQEWYRKKWFDSSFPFSFMTGDERPIYDTEFLTLETLRSLNGIGCPFANFDVNEKREFEKKRKETEERLRKILKEITSLQQNFTSILNMEKNIDRVEKQLEELTTLVKREQPNKPSVKVKQSIEEIGNAVATYILDAFAVYASGDFGSWKKERTEEIESALRVVTSGEAKKTCERILVERMKEKDFFCCIICNEVLFNYKQALIHFASSEHLCKEPAVVKTSGVCHVRRVLDAFTKLPAKLAMEDTKREGERRNRYGSPQAHQLSFLRPQFHEFSMPFMVHYGYIVTTDHAIGRVVDDSDPFVYSAEVAVENLKGDIGRKMMAELHAHMGNAPTVCFLCNLNTGDNEGFYSHHLSYEHLMNVKKTGKGRDLIMLLVNVLRKDLV